jgi:hypothetical protein
MVEILTKLFSLIFECFTNSYLFYNIEISINYKPFNNFSGLTVSIDILNLGLKNCSIPNLGLGNGFFFSTWAPVSPENSLDVVTFRSTLRAGSFGRNFLILHSFLSPNLTALNLNVF